MKELVERIRREGRNLGRGILKVDGFINHQLDPVLTMEMGQCNATLCGIGCLVEKSFEGGCALLASLNVPIIALAIIESMDGESLVVRDAESAQG